MGRPSSAHDARVMVKYDYHQYEVIGRHVPTERDPQPKAYRIKLFTKNETQARSRFWYFIRRLVKMKKANAEILSIKEIYEKKPEKVSKYGIWLRYDSRSGTTNMYKEFSALTQNRGCPADVPGDGWSPPCSFQLHSHHQGARDRSIEVHSGQHQAISEGQHCFPPSSPHYSCQQEGLQQRNQGPVALHNQAVIPFCVCA